MTLLTAELGRQILHELLRAVHTERVTFPHGGVHLSDDITHGLDGTVHLHDRPVNLLVRVSLAMLRREQWLMFPAEPDGQQSCLITGSGMAVFRDWETRHPEAYAPDLLGREVVPPPHWECNEASLTLGALNDCFHDIDGTDTL